MAWQTVCDILVQNLYFVRAIGDVCRRFHSAWVAPEMGVGAPARFETHRTIFSEYEYGFDGVCVFRQIASFKVARGVGKGLGFRSPAGHASGFCNRSPMGSSRDRYVETIFLQLFRLCDETPSPV